MGSSYQIWRIEVQDWRNLDRPRHYQTMRLVGDYSGEWWGAGRFEFANSHRAYDCAAELRGLGLSTRVILRIR
jgi:hypothetical protein